MSTWGKPEHERLYAKIEPEPMSGCWLWTGAATARGYGMFCLNGKSMHAHRAVYLVERGPIADGLVLDHLCRNHSCVNPDHLEPVTQAINVLRGDRHIHRDGVCAHCGSELERTGKTRMRCRPCHRAASLRAYHKRAFLRASSQAT